MAIGIMKFADFKEHTNPVFIDLKILKFHIIWFQTAVFMHDFHHSNLPLVFNQFFLLFEFQSHQNLKGYSSGQSHFSVINVKLAEKSKYVTHSVQRSLEMCENKEKPSVSEDFRQKKFYQ